MLNDITIDSFDLTRTDDLALLIVVVLAVLFSGYELSDHGPFTSREKRLRIGLFATTIFLVVFCIVNKVNFT